MDLGRIWRIWNEFRISIIIIEVLGNFNDLFAILFILMLAYIVFSIIIVATDGDFMFINVLKRKSVIFIFLVISIVNIALPTKDDMYKIYIASQVGTVDDAIDKTKQTIDYIVGKIKEVDKNAK